MGVRQKEYFMSKTPRQIGLENTTEELYEARDTFLPEMLRKEWVIFPKKSLLYQYLDDIPRPEMFNNYYVRNKIDATNEEIAIACAIYGAINIAEGLKILTYNMITLKEYAQKYGRDSVCVRQKCLRGGVIGAINIGRDWFVPENADYTDFRCNKWEKERRSVKIMPENSQVDRMYFMSKTPRQIGFECTQKYLEQALEKHTPQRLWNKWHLFPSSKSILRKLDQVQLPKMYMDVLEKKNITDITAEEMAIACTIHCAISVIEARNAIFYHTLTLKMYARNLGKNPDIVRQKCLRGNLEGAVKIGAMWYIPEKTDYYRKASEWRSTTQP